MNKIYLVRHGETKWNKIKKIQGTSDIELTPKGFKQAKKIANRLANEKIDLIYSSDLKRAYKTAEIIANKLKLKVNVSQALREINFGCWEGLTLSEIQNKYSNEYLLWMTEPHKLQISNAETLMIVKERTVKFIKEIINNSNDKNILVVSHGAAIKAFILGILNIDISHINKLVIDNVSLSIIEFRDYNPVLKLLNDTSHLKED